MDDAFFESLPRRWKRELPAVNAATVALFSRLSLLARQVDRFHAGVLRRFKIAHAEYVVLVTLRVVGPPYRLSPTQLGRVLRQTSAGITNTVDRLERARLVARGAAPDDRRSLRVGLTATGIKVAERLFDVEMAAQQALLAGMGAAERQRTAVAIRRLNLLFDVLPEPTAKRPSRGWGRRSVAGGPVGRGTA
ncbi:MAG: MarR family transcriptional regulator [Candidatus Binatia bacterium]